jgi:hypothetical protein
MKPPKGSTRLPEAMGAGVAGFVKENGGEGKLLVRTCRRKPEMEDDRRDPFDTFPPFE